jgi:arylsulfatase A-like enzyme
MSDDHGEQAISAYGSQLIQTPNIDRIANEGIRFTSSFVTNSLCAPSRAVLLTGKYSHLNRLRDNRDQFDGSQMTFPKLLQKAGYQTGIVGKWHLKTEPTGFDYWKILIGQGEYYNPDFNEMGQKVRETGYVTDVITDFALDFLEHRDPNKPFCLLYHHKAPHRNWMPNAKYMDLYDDRTIPEPETFWDDYKGRIAAQQQDMRIAGMYLSMDMKLFEDAYGKETGTGGQVGFPAGKVWEMEYNRMTDEQKAAWNAHYDKVNEEYKQNPPTGKALTEWKYQRFMKDYLRCIASVDDNVGRVLDYLDEHGLAKNTIVVYTSDQGFYLGEHGWFDKRFMYEESFEMPLMIRYPAEIEAGQVSDDLVMNLDFAPTFLDFAGVDVPEEMQGVSLRPLMEGAKPDNWRDAVYYHYYEYPHGWHKVKQHYGVRTDRYKLIHFYNDIDVWELYDLQKDPHELNNVYGQPEYAEVQAKLYEKLKELQQQYKDTNPESDELPPVEGPGE